MTTFLLYSTTPITHPYKSTTLSISCSSKPHKTPIISKTIPARDITIDFGKHKGKMLGTLPSTYLKWVSNNLRARDFEHWANLADQVLQDPVYNDRIEWEFAESVLTGNKIGNNNYSSKNSSVSQLVELSERFGWDNEDKIGWSKVNFELLGTSKGGRIPRRNGSSEEDTSEVEKKGVRVRARVKASPETEERRRERRLRVKEKMMGKLRNLQDVINGGGKTLEKSSSDDQNLNNRFPGREGLLKKVMMSRPQRFL